MPHGPLRRDAPPVHAARSLRQAPPAPRWRDGRLVPALTLTVAALKEFPLHLRPHDTLADSASRALRPAAPGHGAVGAAAHIRGPPRRGAAVERDAKMVAWRRRWKADPCAN